MWQPSVVRLRPVWRPGLSMRTATLPPRDLSPTLPEACEPVSCVRLTARVVAPASGHRRRMPTLLGVGSELWIELEQGAQGGAVASAEAHPRKNLQGLGDVHEGELAQRRPPRTLREDQPRLAEAYQREAERILAREASAWSLAARLAQKTRMEKPEASPAHELAAE